VKKKRPLSKKKGISSVLFFFAYAAHFLGDAYNWFMTRNKHRVKLYDVLSIESSGCYFAEEPIMIDRASCLKGPPKECRTR
jgi:hypothetical protein